MPIFFKELNFLPQFNVNVNEELIIMGNRDDEYDYLFKGKLKLSEYFKPKY